MHSADVNLDIGFIPDVFLFWAMEDSTNPNLTAWFERQYHNEADGDKEGMLTDGSGTVNIAMCADSQGITEYDTKTEKVMIVHPGSGEEVAASVSDWATATNYSTGERSATAIGTIVRPPIHNNRVFELTTDTSTGDGEPTTWDVNPGETVTDDGGNIWTCRDEKVITEGKKGVTIASQLQTNDKYAYWVAFKSVQHKDGGDSANW